MAFNTAVYTDVSRDEATDGLDGFNFQSVSPGLDGTDLRCIRESLLHQISLSWPIERDELDHPPTAAYLREHGRLYFSQGMSTGRTLNGRRGNQLTQAIVTQSAEDLEPYRPAQLFAATNWNLQRAATTDSPQWFAPLEIDPSFEAESLIAALHADPWQKEVLPAFLSMLEQALGDQPRKVVLIHEDLATVMRWFSLGTLLLAPEDAERLEFRAFASDPFQTRAQLVGVHPALRHGPISGAYVIDIAGQTVGDIPITDRAKAVAFWLSKFDTFDALEIIGIAQRWMPLIGARAGAAGAEMVTGNRAAAVGRSEWELGIEVIEGLSRAGLNDDLLLYLDELSDSVATYRLQSEADFRRAARSTSFAAQSNIRGLSQAILVPSLESLAADPLASKAWAQELSADRDWVWPAAEDDDVVADLVIQIMAGAPEDALPDLLTVARPLAGRLTPSALQAVVQRAGEYVLRNPATAEGIDRWYGAERITQAIRCAILADIESAPGPSRTLDQLRHGTWDFLGGSTDTSTTEAVSLQSWLFAAQLARLPIPERIKALDNGGIRPGPGSWRLALETATLPEHIDLFVSWVRACGIDPQLRAAVHRKLGDVLLQDPQTAKSRDVQAWVPLAEALAEADPGDSRSRQAATGLSDLIEKIPSALERTKEKTDALFNRLTRRGKE